MLPSLHDPSHAALVQEPPEVPEAQRVKKLSGPRFGFTTFTGDVADQRKAANLEPMMTQLDWQWETWIVSLTGRKQGLIE